MNECKSKGLRSTLEQLKTTFLTDIDCVMLNESNWIGKDYPCLVYGMRGVCYFNLTIEGPCKDLNSGDFGGIVREPMQDLLYIISRLLIFFGLYRNSELFSKIINYLIFSLVDPYDKITIPHFYDDIVPVTPEEEGFYRKIKIDVAEYKNNVGVNKLGHNENLKSVFMHVWRYPWFNMHYINSSCENGNSLDIPKKIVARFSIR